MSNLIELSAERLMKLEAEIRAALEFGPNEADTRLKVLDRFLFEVLDWQRDTSVEAEPPTESGYIDYLLKIGENRGAMVVEAKRKGKLEPATKQSDVLNVTLSGPVVQPMMSGIKQAMTYAMEQGVAVACVTDGNTWLFLQGLQDRWQEATGGQRRTLHRSRRCRRQRWEVCRAARPWTNRGPPPSGSPQ